MQREEEKLREKEKLKPREIDKYMEERKQDYEMRDKRNQEREHWRDGRPIENSAVCVSLNESGFQFLQKMIWMISFCFSIGCYE